MKEMFMAASTPTRLSVPPLKFVPQNMLQIPFTFAHCITSHVSHSWQIHAMMAAKDVDVWTA
jgi:hypothetical protein